MAILERPRGHELLVLDDEIDRITVGTSPENGLVIDDDSTVSRVHAALERFGPAWCINDLGSTNGTIVNGTPIYSPRTLRDGDEVVLGRTLLRFRDRQARDGGATERLSAPPTRTPGEQRVLVELCRPVLSGKVFTPPSSVRAIAATLHVGEAAVKQHLGHLYDKFEIHVEDGESRRVRLANEAIQRGAVSLHDLRE
jgi:hypothetical protein